MRTFETFATGAAEYFDRTDIHEPHWHHGRQVCGKCSLDMSQSILPVQWPCPTITAIQEALN